MADIEFYDKAIRMLIEAAEMDGFGFTVNEDGDFLIESDDEERVLW